MQTVYICLITHNTLIHIYILLSFTSIYPARGMYSMSTLVILVLPTEYLRAPSARRGTPMDPSRVRGLTYRREGRISRRRWQSNTYSVRTRTKFVSPCINIPQCRHFITFARAFAALGNVAVYPVWHTVLYILHHLLDRLRKGY